jgi:hypothetical protein
MRSARGGARHPLVELTLARFREFLREPEAVFWVFMFPVIMTCALGIAFRSRGAEPVIAGIVEQAGADAVARVLESAGGFTVRRIPPGEVDRAVRDGRAPVVIVPGTPPTYRFDQARAESRWRAWPSIARCSAPPDAPTHLSRSRSRCRTSGRATSTGWCRACSA